jgi:hypothetical protein
MGWWEAEEGRAEELTLNSFMKSILCDHIFHFDNLELSRVFLIPAFLEEVKTRGSSSSTANAKAFFEERFDDVACDKACFERKREKVSGQVAQSRSLMRNLTVSALVAEQEESQQSSERGDKAFWLD